MKPPEIPVPPVGVGSVEIFNEVVALADEEVICKHDADEAAHEDTHPRDTGEEDGAGDEHFPGYHAPAADEAADDLCAHDVDVFWCHGGGVDAEWDQVCDEVGADLTNHECEGH